MPTPIDGWREPIAFYKRLPVELGEFVPPFLYLPVTHKTLPFLRGAGAGWMNENAWEGTQEEIDGALQAMALQLGADALEATVSGIEQVEIDIVDGELLYRVMINGVWGDWQSAGIVPAGEQGPPGNDGEQGPPGEDGWVHVGFYMPYLVNTPDPTKASLFLQWYCRVDATSNSFLPEGDPYYHSDIDLPIGPQGVPGDDGAPGPYFQITSSNPVPEVAYFFRQLMVWNGTEYEPFGEPAQFGGIIAPEGPQGPQGEAGPPGATGPEGPAGPAGPAGSGLTGTVVWPASHTTEFTKLSFLARELVDQTLEKQLFHWTGAAVVLDALMSMVTIKDVVIPGPGGAISSGFISWAQSEVGRTEAAELLYCSLIPYRDMSDFSLAAFRDAYGNYDWSLDYFAGNYAEMTRNWVANWMHPDYAKARWDMGIILGGYYYDEDFDYSSLPCTPDIGEWSRSYDLTVDDHGWRKRPLWGGYGDVFGEWVDGKGFVGKYRPAGGDFGTDGWHGACEILIPSGCTVTHITAYVTSCYHNSNQYRGRFFYHQGENIFSSSLAMTEGDIVGHSFNFPFSPSGYMGYMFQYGDNENMAIARIDVSGNGTPLS